MNSLLQQAFSLVSQLPETEQNEIAKLIFQKISQKIPEKLPQKLSDSKNVDFMQFAGIANEEERIILQNLEREIEEQRSLDLERQIEV